MGDGIKAFWLGLFIIITLSVAAWLLLFLRPTVGDCGHVLKVRFANIQNVSIGTRVTFGGKPVGEVLKIQEIPNARTLPPDASGNYYFYELDLCVDSSVTLYNYDEIVFSSAGLMGERSIAILPKAAPAGKPPAHEVTQQILYARSTDDVQEALTKLADVADVFEHAMSLLSEFLDENMEDFHHTLHAVGEMATTANELFVQARDSHLLAHLDDAATTLGSTFGQLSRGEGTLGRLLTSDSFYLQLTAVMCKLETVLNDISSYGLLFQYDRRWQRKRSVKECQMQRLCSPEAAMTFFNNQICEVTNSLERVERLLCQLKRPPADDECFSKGFCELMGRVEHLTLSLKTYREMLFENYCDSCH